MKRSILLCSVVLALVTSLVLPAYSAVEMYKINAATPTAPEFVQYTLNCPATVTVKIEQIKDANGNPVTPTVVKTATITETTKGNKTYVWPATKDDGTAAPAGTYQAKVSASTTQADWNSVYGLFSVIDLYNANPQTRPLPGGNAAMQGPHGIGVNKNPNSPYYGCVYAGKFVDPKKVLMYGPDGKYIKEFEITSSTWNASAPWNISVADDGYVYVSDRTATRIYCFTPDGQFVSRSPLYINYRGMGVRVDSATGITHIFMSGTTFGVHRVTVSADHLTWSPMPALGTVAYNPGVPTGDGEAVFDMWISPDFSTIYQATNAGTNKGISKWQKAADPGVYTYTKVPFATGVDRALPTKSIIDVDMGPDGYLWATDQTMYSTDNPTTTQVEPEARAIHKINLTTGAEVWSGLKDGLAGDYDILTASLFSSTDGVGNIAVTFGKPTTTWGQQYWGLFAEPGTNSTVERTTGTFLVDADPRPVVVPGSEVWSNFSNANYPDKLFPNGSATAKLTFKVIDANGTADIGTVTLNLTALGGGAAVAPDTRTNDPGDPNVIICTKTVTAANGTFCGINSIGCTVADVHGASNPATFSVDVVGNQLTGTVQHMRWMDNFGAGGLVEGAQIVAMGGKAGVPGIPFTYRSPATYNDGSAVMDISEGTYEVWAERIGFKSQAHKMNVIVSVPPSAPGTPINVGQILLGPITIAECRTMTGGTVVSTEGVCFAQPKGVAPTAAFGLEPRAQAAPSGVIDRKYQFYLCDPGNAAAGMQFALKMTNPAGGYPYTWDDPNAQDPDFGTPYYIGKRPAVGETIVVTGSVGYLGYERRVMLNDNFDLVPRFEYNFLNRGVVVGMSLPATPAAVTVTDVYHAADSNAYDAKWAKYAKLSNATFVMWKGDGKQMSDNTSPTEALPYAVVADTAGNWCSITFETAASLNIPVPSDYPTSGPTALVVGNSYNFTGATGRRARFTEGTIRVRGPEDIVQTSTAVDPGADTVSLIRDVANGGTVNVRGIITASWSTFFYIEDSNRFVGVRVKGGLPPYLKVGDDVQVIGTINVENGERVITPTSALIPRVPHLFQTAGTLPAAFALSTRDFGGADYDANNPGIAGGRGANNIGLRVKLGGMVTYKDPGGAFYYLWDGANKTDAAVTDDSGYKGVRVMASTTAVPWTQWIEVTGVASTSKPTTAGPVYPTLRPTSTSIVTAFDTVTAPDGTLGANWNLITIPAAPAGTGTGSEFDFKAWDPFMILGPNKVPDDLDSRLYRFESTNQGMYLYDMYSEPGGAWGAAVAGDGYWLKLDEAWPITYTTKIHTLDTWTSIAMDGWLLAGHTKLHPIEINNLALHDGKQIRSMYNACFTDGWLSPTGYWFDNTTQGMVDIGLPDTYPTTTTMTPWHGYWFQINSANKALLIPEVDAPIVPDVY